MNDPTQNNHTFPKLSHNMSHQTPYSLPLQCLIFLLLATPLIASGIALMVLFLPHSPKFKIVSFEASPIILTPLDDSSLLMSATWNLTFFARNPNKRLQISYNDVDVSLYYKWISLSSQRLGFFKQSAKSEDVVCVNVVRKFSRLSNQVMEAIEKDGEDLAVNFNVKLRGTVRVYIGSLMGVNHALSINCDDVKVGFFPQNNGTGMMMGASRGCYSNKLIF